MLNWLPIASELPGPDLEEIRPVICAVIDQSDEEPAGSWHWTFFSCSVSFLHSLVHLLVFSG